MASARPAPELYPGLTHRFQTDGARALKPEYRPQSAAVLLEDAPPVPESRAKAEPRVAPFQPTLFTTRELGRVVPIEQYQPTPSPKPAERPVRTVRPIPRANREQAAPSEKDLLTAHQQAFQFATVAITTPRQRMVPPQEALRYANAPVAIPLHRALATAVDATIVLAAVTMMALVVHALIGLDVFGDYILPAVGAMAAVVAIGYKLLWIWANTDSPGLAWTQLRLLNFDGKVPTQRQRLQRLAWSCLSFLPAGLGLLWSLVDEETLTWHDHSSETFLTSFCATHRG